MNKLRLISLRIDESTLAVIDNLAANHPYWKRNYIINVLMTQLMTLADDDTIFRLMSYHDQSAKLILTNTN